MKRLVLSRKKSCYAKYGTIHFETLTNVWTNIAANSFTILHCSYWIQKVGSTHYTVYSNIDYALSVKRVHSRIYIWFLLKQTAHAVRIIFQRIKFHTLRQQYSQILSNHSLIFFLFVSYDFMILKFLSKEKYLTW